MSEDWIWWDIVLLEFMLVLLMFVRLGIFFVVGGW